MNRETSQKFKRLVWAWHKQHAPALPWRVTTNSYHILVSEVMLQQTQIPRVLVKYPKFLEVFPSIKVLASSPLPKVLKVWQGMGYNRRGVYLKKSAEIIEEIYQGNVPSDTTSLQALPGIGPYSARAIRCFAYGKCEPFIETNIRRAVIHNFFPTASKIHDEEILEILEKVRPKKDARAWYYALMDYGRDAVKNIPNPNRRSHSYHIQTRFEGSTRHMRSLILKFLLQQKKATEKEILRFLQKEENAAKLPISQIKTILATLLKDGLVKNKGKFYFVE